ncbi:MAG TPA: FtsH protease activity modulator HflK [Candidatus Marinimicrobia bacterium]|jgi:membrane protease subunit HflK|nr:FtsH protease activity modulator HflK [Candidatus Neomarinimicrobiota bacterium]HHZ99634.1 FtsH protease activity modulator HflK [Candidatus Neomarinimicrobiota bacterium]HIB03622.1 FtsH protease activity modulator HflK [Candidatus Neomarinimicrobiota bacterium]HIB71107.1 FtsH protease activity modulator HflK [Candidatus Neomarinimicrobiota bacterium]HIB95969.1 FtsH protease activity modulator HflK [Candidatus Neomarinimicrobiota bacterium]
MARKIMVGDQEITIPTFNIGGLAILLLVVGAWFVLSAFFIVGPDEEGVVRRFGKWVRTEPSGLHFKFPYPIEKVDLPKVTQVQQISVGRILKEAKMLTGDENILLVEVRVQYKIKDAAQYLFNVRNVEELIKDATESALRQTIGSHPIDDPLTEKKAEIMDEIQLLLQQMLDDYKCGIDIRQVQLQDVNPPQEVDFAFKDVQSAKEEKEQLINQALGYQNDLIPKARGEAVTMIREAEGYREERVKRAEGDASRFLSVLAEYRKAKNVTEKRLYLETMEQILPGIDKVILDEEAGNLLNILPLGNLGGVMKTGVKK